MLKVALLEHHNNPYPVQCYGGIERIQHALFEGLVLEGNDGYNNTLVQLIVVEGSKLNIPEHYSPCYKIITLPFSEIEDLRYGRRPFRDYIDPETDIIQTATSGAKNCNFDFSGLKAIHVATNYGCDIETMGCDHQVLVSYGQYHGFIANDIDPLKTCKNLYFIESGFLSSGFKPGPNKRQEDQLVYIGGIRPNKGIHVAIEVATQLGMRLNIYGNIQDQNYFTHYIEPKLSNAIRYRGEINDEYHKIMVLQDAAAFIHCALYNEAGAVTLMEAQCCGTPVIGLNKGCLLEYCFYKDLLLNNQRLDILKIRKGLANVDNIRLHRWAEAKFNEARLARDYLNLYRLLAR